MNKRQSKFNFCVDAIISKLNLSTANLANPANRLSENVEISKISRISNAPIENIEIEKMQRTTAEITIFLSHPSKDIEGLKSFLGKKDWDEYKDSPEALKYWAEMMIANNLMQQGIAPEDFTATTWCDTCGNYVYAPSSLTKGGRVLMCPWCWNRIKGLPIPKPITD